MIKLKNCKKGFACRRACIAKTKECKVSASDNAKQRLNDMNSNIARVALATGSLPPDFLDFITSGNKENNNELINTVTQEKVEVPVIDSSQALKLPKKATNKALSKKADFFRAFNPPANFSEIVEQEFRFYEWEQKIEKVLQSSPEMTKSEALAMGSWVSNGAYYVANKARLGLDTNKSSLAASAELEKALLKAPRFSTEAVAKRYDGSDSRFLGKQTINKKAIGENNSKEEPNVKHYESFGRDANSDYFLKRNVNLTNSEIADFIGRTIGEGNLNSGVHSNDTFEAYTYKLNLDYFDSSFEMLLKPKTEGDSNGRLVDQYKNLADEGEVLFPVGTKFKLAKIEIDNSVGGDDTPIDNATKHLKTMSDTEYSSVKDKKYIKDTKIFADLLKEALQNNLFGNNKVRLFLEEV